MEYKSQGLQPEAQKPDSISMLGSGMYNGKMMSHEAPEFGSKPGFFQNFKRRFSHGTLHVPCSLKLNKSRASSLASLFHSNSSSPCTSQPITPTPSRKGSVCTLDSEAVRANERRFDIVTPLPVYEDDMHFQLGYDMRKDQPECEFDRIVNKGYGMTLNGRQFTLQLTLTPEIVRSQD